MEDISVEELDAVLYKFYAELRRKEWKRIRARQFGGNASLAGQAFKNTLAVRTVFYEFSSSRSLLKTK